MQFYNVQVRSDSSLFHHKISDICFWSLQILMNALRRMEAALMGVTILLVATSVTVQMDMCWTLINTLALVHYLCGQLPV